MSNHDADLIDTMRLALVDGVGPRIRRRLLDRFGDPLRDVPIAIERAGSVVPMGQL